jgi:hypothetical protein
MRSSYIRLTQVHFLTFKIYVTFLKFLQLFLVKTLLHHYSWVSSTRPINVVRLLDLVSFFCVYFVVLVHMVSLFCVVVPCEWMF